MDRNQLSADHEEFESVLGTLPKASGHIQPDCEQKLQVDRRLLEAMILGDAQNAQLEGAGGFFARVASNTGTDIFWPTRLKIGAKSKKDPYIRVCGSVGAVNNAKIMILRELRPKQNRTTLKMDVSYTDHSHIIGRGGKNTQAVMRHTGCHVHFPDSNKSKDVDKSNQVTIAGPIDSVEMARSSIRSLAPLTITFPMCHLQQGILLDSLVAHPALEKLVNCPEVSVLVRVDRESAPSLPCCVVRGSVHQEALVLRAVANICQKFLAKEAQPMFTCSVEVLPSEQARVCGPDDCNMVQIARHTGAYIKHPSMHEAHQGATTFLFGSNRVLEVVAARKQLLGLLPVQLSFEAAELSQSDAELAGLERDFDVQISTKWRLSADNMQVKLITIRAVEMQLCEVYLVRSRLLGDVGPVPSCNEYKQNTLKGVQMPFPNLMPPPPPVMDSSGRLVALGPTPSQVFLPPRPSNMNVPAMAYPAPFMPYPCSNMAMNNYGVLPGLPYNPHHSSAIHSPQNTVPSMTSVSQVHSNPMSMPANQQNLSHQQNSSSATMPNWGAQLASQVICGQRTTRIEPSTLTPPSSPQLDTDNMEAETNNENFQSVVNASVETDNCSMVNGLSLASSAENARSQQIEATIISQTEHYLTDSNKVPPLTLQSHDNDLVDSTQPTIDPLPEQNPLASGMLQITKQMNNVRVHRPNDQDWRVVGGERRALPIDYQQQRVLAYKAMQQEPNGARRPSDVWCGMGFSRTTHAQYLRAALSAQPVPPGLTPEFSPCSSGGSSGEQQNTVSPLLYESVTSYAQSARPNSLNTTNTCGVSPFMSANSINLGKRDARFALPTVDEDQNDAMPEPVAAVDQIQPQLDHHRRTMMTGARTATDFGVSTVVFDVARASDSVLMLCHNTDDVLTALSLSHLCPLFREHEIDLETFMGLDDSDLREMGVQKAHRRKISSAVLR